MICVTVIPELGTWRQKNSGVQGHPSLHSEFKNTGDLISKKNPKMMVPYSLTLLPVPSSPQPISQAHGQPRYSENYENIIITECLGFCARMPH